MQIAEDMGMKVERRPIALEELAEFQEAGACGTAAVISPIERLDDPETGHSYNFGKEPGPWCKKLYERLRAIQLGEYEDVHNWNTILD